MILYRCMSEAELQDLLSTGVFRSALGAMEGKWFAVNLDDLPQWSDWFRRVGGIIHDTIVEAEVPDWLVQQAHFARRLDGIGPAYYFEEAQLPVVSFIRVVR